MEKILYKVYVKLDSDNCITTVDSSAFLQNTAGWVQIDEGSEYRYKHAQANYFPKPLYTTDGLLQYKLVDGTVIERSQKELEEEWLLIVKTQRIARSKTDLEIYLRSHPLQWTDGEYYSITQEKQNQLTAILVAAQVDQQAPEWNSTGNICKQWQLEDLTALALAIRNKVKSLVKYQQEKEIAIKNAISKEELDAIEIDYNSVQ